MLSMTGYASHLVETDRFNLQIDIRSVNSKYSDLRLNATFCDNNFLEKLRKQSLLEIGRGQVTIDMTLKTNKGNNEKYVFNTAQLNQYIQAYENQFGEFVHDFEHLKHFFQMDHLTEKEEIAFDEEIDGLIVQEALKESLDKFYTSRAEEGEKLRKDFLLKVERLQAACSFIESRVPTLNQAYRDRLEARIKELIESLTEIDESRILTEVAVFATKTTVDEELVRLNSHLIKLKELINSDSNAIGKKLDFYMQEVNREYNTIASKISDLSVSEQIVECKVLVDQIREQAQNIM